MKTINLETIKTKIAEVKDSIHPIQRVKSIQISDIKEKPYNAMIESAFWMAGKLPVAGKVATRVLDNSNLETKSKDFANKFFNPFYFTAKFSAVKK